MRSCRARATVLSGMGREGRPMQWQWWHAAAIAVGSSVAFVFAGVAWIVWSRRRRAEAQLRAARQRLMPSRDPQ